MGRFGLHDHPDPGPVAPAGSTFSGSTLTAVSARAANDIWAVGSFSAWAVGITLPSSGGYHTFVVHHPRLRSTQLVGWSASTETRSGGEPAVRQAFWIDENFDREHVTDGRSRYGAEVSRRVDEFADAWGDIAPVTFAVVPWRLATTGAGSSAAR